MPPSFITCESERGVTRITFNRPEVLNSFHSAMGAEVLDALTVAESDPSVRAVLVTGSGRAFSAGQDLEEVAPGGARPPADFAAHVRRVYNPIVRAIRTIEKPVVAAVNGVAAGAGANLALACDIVVASSAASFIQAFSKIGLVPDTGGTYFLPRLIGTARATALMFLGDRLSAEQAVSYGMIHRVCAPEELADESMKLAVLLAGQATRGLGLTKRLLNGTFERSLEAQLELEAELQGAAGRTEDYAEGVLAFRNKRAPVFNGR